jgi:hypothetical protein
MPVEERESVCVCACVCVRERERESSRGKEREGGCSVCEVLGVSELLGVLLP